MRREQGSKRVVMKVYGLRERWKSVTINAWSSGRSCEMKLGKRGKSLKGSGSVIRYLNKININILESAQGRSPGICNFSFGVGDRGFNERALSFVSRLWGKLVSIMHL